MQGSTVEVDFASGRGGEAGGGCDWLHEGGIETLTGGRSGVRRGVQPSSSCVAAIGVRD